MSYFLYILHSCEKNRYYIGQSENPIKRLNEHRIRKNLGASDWKLVLMQEYNSRSEAVKMEMLIKSKKSKKFIEFLISNHTKSVPQVCGKVTGTTPVFSTNP